MRAKSLVGVRTPSWWLSRIDIMHLHEKSSIRKLPAAADFPVCCSLDCLCVMSISRTWCLVCSASFKAFQRLVCFAYENHSKFWRLLRRRHKALQGTTWIHRRFVYVTCLSYDVKSTLHCLFTSFNLFGILAAILALTAPWLSVS